MNYKIKKHIHGPSVHYKCESCNEPLNSPIEEAGNLDRCPTCSHQFEVPGKNERTHLEMERKAQAIENQQKLKKTTLEAEQRLLQQQKDSKQREKIEAQNLAKALQQEQIENQNQHRLRQDHLEAYRLNLWAWRFFMLGIVFTFLGGFGLLLQIPALYLAAKASSKSDGVYGERLWRGVRNYFIVVVSIITAGVLIFASNIISNDTDPELGIDILVGVGVYTLIGYFLSLQFKHGIKADAK